MYKTISLLIIIVLAAACSTPDPIEPTLAGPYLDQPDPGNRLELFAPGIVSNGLHNRDIWSADREGDSWSEPYNLGSPVNSDSEELRSDSFRLSR